MLLALGASDPSSNDLLTNVLHLWHATNFWFVSIFSLCGAFGPQDVKKKLNSKKVDISEPLGSPISYFIFFKNIYYSRIILKSIFFSVRLFFWIWRTK
jgi:hypothetical protein